MFFILMSIRYYLHLDVISLCILDGGILGLKIDSKGITACDKIVLTLRVHCQTRVFNRE